VTELGTDVVLKKDEETDRESAQAVAASDEQD
jgi:hypothetical protein